MGARSGRSGTSGSIPTPGTSTSINGADVAAPDPDAPGLSVASDTVRGPQSPDVRQEAANPGGIGGVVVAVGPPQVALLRANGPANHRVRAQQHGERQPG